ncbi:MAG: NUDIX domain-containing protein [Patescibacteria group bacterium]
MEYLDVLDEKGNKTGESKSKPEIHEKGFWHRTVHIWLMNSKKELLLQLRSKTKKTYPGFWDISAAGHIGSGEESLSSAKREIGEEIGIEISDKNITLIGTVTQKDIISSTYINNEFNDVYLVKTDLKIEDFKFNDGEVEKVEYIPIETLKGWVRDQKSDLVPHPSEYELLFKSI